MPNRRKGRKRPMAGPAAIAVERWENEGGALTAGDKTRNKREIEKPFRGDFLEHPGSVGEMHFAYDNRNKDAHRTSQPTKPPPFDWRDWVVPPIVIPAVIITAILARALHLYV